MTIHAKAKVLGGKATIYCYGKDPTKWFIRVLKPGTKSYVVRLIPEATNQADAEAGCLDAYVAAVDGIANPPAASKQRRAATENSYKPAKRKRVPIREELERFLQGEKEKVLTNRIGEESFSRKARSLRKDFVGYLNFQEVTYCDQINNTFLERYPYYRRGRSKQTIKKELKAIAQFIKNWLGRRKLVDAEVLFDTEFVPKIKITMGDLNANPSINAGDWLTINREIRRQVKESRDFDNHRHHYWRELWWCFTYVAKSSGCRPIELRKLKWKDVDLVEVTEGEDRRYICYLFIRETKTGNPREVPCWSRTSTRLLHWRSFQNDYCKKHNLPPYGPNDYVFGKPEADKLQYSSASYYYMWRKTINNVHERLTGNRFSEKPYTIYSLRSTFIENHLSRGVDAYLVARISGHDIKTMHRFYDRSDVRSRSRELTILELPDERQKRVPIFNREAEQSTTESKPKRTSSKDPANSHSPLQWTIESRTKVGRRQRSESNH